MKIISNRLFSLDLYPFRTLSPLCVPFHHYLLISFSLVILSCSSSPTDEQTIIESRVAFNRAIAEHDTSRMGEFCADDIIVVSSRNARAIGRTQYASVLDQDYKSKQDVIYIRTPSSIDVFPAWEMAAESGHWIGKWKNGDEAIEVTGSYYAKWKKVNNRWFIVAEVFSPLTCNGGIYCDTP